jgi:hypothetical protein
MNVIRSVEYFGAFVGAWAVICGLLELISSPAYLAVVSLGFTIIFGIGFFALLVLVGLAVFLLVNGARRREVSSAYIP